MNLAHRIEDYSTMTPKEAEVLLAQWAVWAMDGARTGCSISQWQKDYRPSFDPEHKEEGRILDRGDDEEMLRVDSALARLGRTDAHNAHVLRARYRLGHHFTHVQLGHAIRQFIYVFEC